MRLQINKSECAACRQEFYEWEESLLNECPHCGASLNEDKSANVIETQYIEVELDVVTGTVKIAGDER